MILEHAILDVRGGSEDDFQTAFRHAAPVIAASKGFRALRLSRCVEHENRYLLLVEWESLADHTEGFRHSASYQEWRRLLHHFYDPFPTVEHFETLIEG